MIKLITPLGMLVTVALLVIYSLYALRIGLLEDSWILSAAGGLSIAAAYGTAMLRPWSQYLVYLLTAGFVGKLVYSILAAIRAGFFDFYFATTLQVVWSLTPGAVMALISCVCALMVFRHFRSRARVASDLSASAGTT